MGRPPLKQAYTVHYEKGGIELQRYTITALNQADAETADGGKVVWAEFGVMDMHCR